MNKRALSEYFSKIGSKGGKKSRRSLSSEEARAMALKSAKARSVGKRSEKHLAASGKPKTKSSILKTVQDKQKLKK